MRAEETSAPAHPTPEGIDPRPWTVMECVVTAERTEVVGDHSVRRTARLDGYADRMRELGVDNGDDDRGSDGIRE